MNGGVSLLLKNNEGQFSPVWPDKSHLLVTGDAKALTISDLNNDGLPDFHVSVNAGKAIVFEANPKQMNPDQFLCLQLKGAAGNIDASGARVTLSGKSFSTVTQQISSGGGYLSQSSPRLFFQVGSLKSDDLKGLEVQVLWPSGEEVDVESGSLEKGRWPILDRGFALKGKGVLDQICRKDVMIKWATIVLSSFLRVWYGYRSNFTRG